MVTRTKFIAALAGTLLATACFALPVGAADSNDTFTSANAAPEITIVSVTALEADGDPQGDAVWYPTVTDVEVVFTVEDDNTVHGSTSTICFTNDGVCAAGTNGYDEAGYTVTEATNSTSTLTKVTSGTWGSTTHSVSQSANWNATSVTFTVRITVGAIARATALDGTWTVLATVNDGAASDDDTSAGHTVADYLNMTGSVADRDFGSVAATGVSSAVSRTLTGIKANTDWDVSVEVVGDEFVDGDSGTAPVLPDIALDGDGSPSGYNFSLRCDGTATPAVSGVYVTAAPTPVWTAGTAFTTDAAVTQDLGCAIYNGETPPGEYAGTVRTTLTVAP